MPMRTEIDPETGELRGKALFVRSRWPEIGQEIFANGSLMIVEKFSEPFKLHEDMPSIWGHQFLGYEGELVRFAYGRLTMFEGKQV